MAKIALMSGAPPTRQDAGNKITIKPFDRWFGKRRRRCDFERIELDLAGCIGTATEKQTDLQ